MTQRDILGYAAGLQENQEILPYAGGGYMQPRNFKEFAYNNVAAIPNQIYGKGIMAPTSDTVRLAIAAAQGKWLPQSELDSGPVKAVYGGLEGNPDSVVKGGIEAALPILGAMGIKSLAGGAKGLLQPRDNLGRFAKIAGQKPPMIGSQQWKSSLKLSDSARRAAERITSAPKVPNRVSPL